MKNEYGKNCYVIRTDQVEKYFDDSGFSRTELLPEVYDGGIRNYRCFPKAGCRISPELHKNKGMVILPGQGKGVLKDRGGEHAITELTFHVLGFDKDIYEIEAEEEMEFVINVIEFNQWG